MAVHSLTEGEPTEPLMDGPWTTFALRASADNLRVMWLANRSSLQKPRERRLERATGIEPVSEAWEASVLPLY